MLPLHDYCLVCVFACVVRFAYCLDGFGFVIGCVACFVLGRFALVVF